MFAVGLIFPITVSEPSSSSQAAATLSNLKTSQWSSTTTPLLQQTPKKKKKKRSSPVIYINVAEWGLQRNGQRYLLESLIRLLSIASLHVRPCYPSFREIRDNSQAVGCRIACMSIC